MTTNRRLRGLPTRASATFVCALTFIVLSAPTSISAQGAPPPGSAAGVPTSSMGRVRGTVFDSLAKRYVKGATVWIAGTTVSTMSDSTGRYVLDSVPAGRQTLAFSAPAFDSAGLGTLATGLNVRPGLDSTVSLASLSLRRLWTVLCKYRAGNGKDSGIVYGSVTDADSKTRLVKAPTVFRWFDMNKVEKRVSFVETENRADSDSTGTYFACGLPTDVAFTVRAYGNKAASGAIEYSLGERGVTRIDFTVSKELLSLDKPRGTATLHGFVRDGAGAPVGGAVVTATSADTSVRTNEEGEFTLRRLPAGMHGLQVRKIGLGIANKLIELHPNQTTELFVAMPRARTLATYNVRTAKVVTVEESDFEDRRKMGFGTVIDFDKRDFATPLSALNNVPRATLSRERGGSETVTMLNGKNSCNPAYYLNGGKVDSDQMHDYPAGRIRFVEVYTSPYTVPARFTSTGINACGVILCWTRDRW